MKRLRNYLMSNFKFLNIFFLLNFCSFLCAYKEIVVVTASYNNREWYKQNLDSILSQDYPCFRVIYIDDVSPDGTGNLVEAYLKDHPEGYKVTLIKNEERCGALANQYYAIHSCDDKAIIVIADGDDFLADETVLSYIAEVYEHEDVWLTYGRFRCWQGSPKVYCEPIPEHVTKQNLFRPSRSYLSHLRTFYAALYKKIKLEDLLYQGDFFSVNADMATMYPMVEMARNGHFMCMPKVLYLYNNSNPINDHRVNRKEQLSLEKFIRNKKPYEALEKLFDA